MATPPVFVSGSILTAAQMNQVGMWKITPTVSGTGTAINSDGDVILTAAPKPFITAFSADFLNYRVFYTLTAFTGGSSAIQMQPSIANVPNTVAANYRNVGYETPYAGGAAGTVANNGASSAFNFGRVEGGGNFSSVTADFCSPFINTQYLSYNSQFRDNANAGIQNGVLIVTTSYDGFAIFTNAVNTLTGVVQVFGYN